MLQFLASYKLVLLTEVSSKRGTCLTLEAMQGLDALGYSEHIDYELVESTNPAFQKAIVRINVFRDHRQVRHCTASL